MSRRRILYLPVETKTRELLGKTFLAARAVERGWVVIMGAFSEVTSFMKEHPPGIFVAASVPERKAPRLEQIRRSGHVVANLCEESVVYANGREYCDRRLGASSVPWVNRFLVVGRKNAEHIQVHRPELAEKIAVTGNPRFDTLLPELRRVYDAEADRIRQRYGRFILVNTNFGRNNTFKDGEDFVARLMKNGAIRDSEHENFNHRFVRYKTQQMQGLQTLIRELAKSDFADAIVVRPHPVENHDVWRDWAADERNNILVRFEGNANVWMLAAEAVLHPGCTTGVEGLLLDRAVFSYVPVPESEFLNQSDAISEPVENAGQLIERLSGADLSQEGVRDQFGHQREKLSSYVANTAQPFAADRILDQFEQLEVPSMTLDQCGIPKRSFLGRTSWRLRQWSRFAQQSSVTARQAQKLPGISLEDLRRPLACWADDGALVGTASISRLGSRLWAFH